MTKRTCSIEGCKGTLLARKMCGKHYTRFMKHGDATATHRPQKIADRSCTEDQCELPVCAKGLCRPHYERNRRSQIRKATCVKAGCDNAAHTLLMCRRHYHESRGVEYEIQCVICGERQMRALPRNGRRASTCGRACQATLTARIRGYGGESRISTAVRDRDTETFLRLIRDRVHVLPDGCWEWKGFKEKSGYGNTRCDGKTWYVHRLVASMLKPGYAEHLMVHHACARRSCCNPEHLQVVTAKDNTAEMFERNSYKRRIESLEEALRALDPAHALLTDA